MNKEKFLKILQYTSSCADFMRDILGLDVRPFHEEWLDLFERYNFLVLLAPRGHGKSTIIEGYIIWKIILNPDIRILIVTMNQNKADEMMSFIQRHLAYNEKLIELFGEQKGDVWSQSKIRVKGQGQSGKYKKEYTLQVQGVDSSQISSHYDLIILDDVVDKKNSATEHRRRELIDWYNTTLVEMLEPGGKIFDIGTRWHANDLHAYLSSLPIYETRVYKAVIKEPENGGEAEVLWPEKHPWEDTIINGNLVVGLKTIRDKHIGKTAFALQYQNEILQTADSPFKMEWIEEAKSRYEKTVIPSDIVRYMGVDLASKGTSTDNFSATVIGIDQYGNIYVLENIVANASMGRQLEIIKELDAKWNPAKIAIESTATQKIITDEWIQQTNLPIIPMKSSWVNDKWSRAQRLSVLFETGRIYLNPDLYTLIDELIEFPRGAHDDTIDSLSFAIQASQNKKEVDWDKVLRVVSSKSKWTLKRV